MTPADRVLFARKQRGLSQYALSKKAGLAETYVGMVERSLENGRASNEQIRNPGLDSLQKLAVALDVPVEWLAFGSGVDPFADAAPNSSGEPTSSDPAAGAAE